MVAFEEAVERSVVFFGSGLVAGVGEAFHFKGRGDRPECDFNSLHSYARLGGKFAFSNSVGKTSQGGDLLFCGFCGEERVHVSLSAVCLPMIPKALPFFVVCRHDAIVHGSVNSKAMILETTVPLRLNSRQDCFCGNGNVVLNRFRNS